MIHCLKTFDDFASLKEEWDQLYDESGVKNVFMTHEYLKYWLSHFGNDSWVLVIDRNENDENIDGLALFNVDKRKYSFTGCAHSDYPGFLARSGKTGPMGSILRYLVHEQGCTSLELLQSPDEEGFEKQVVEASRNDWFIVKKNEKILRSIDISGGMEAFISGKSKKVRHEIRRKMNRANGSNVVLLECLDRESDADELFSVIQEIEEDSWKSQSETAIFSSETEKGFYRSIFRNYAQAKKALGYVLVVNQTPISYVMGIICDETYYALKTSYRQSYRKLSPGIVLFVKVVEALTQRRDKIRSIELLGEDSRWKYELGDSEKPLCTYHLFSRSLINVIYLSARKVKRSITRQEAVAPVGR